jgi:hypothetical protein
VILRVHRPSTLLRAGLLALLVLGIFARPMLEQLGSVHAIGHAEVNAGDGHHHHEGDEPDEDHGSGLHGLMHHGCMGASADLASTQTVLPQAIPLRTLPLPDIPVVRAHALSSPFRPPIA